MTTDGQHIRKGIIFFLKKKNKKNKIFLKEFCTLLVKVV